LEMDVGRKRGCDFGLRGALQPKGDKSDWKGKLREGGWGFYEGKSNKIARGGEVSILCRGEPDDFGGRARTFDLHEGGTRHKSI